jgi:hypothetical protein
LQAYTQCLESKEKTVNKCIAVLLQGIVMAGTLAAATTEPLAVPEIAPIIEQSVSEPSAVLSQEISRTELIHALELAEGKLAKAVNTGLDKYCKMVRKDSEAVAAITAARKTLEVAYALYRDAFTGVTSSLIYPQDLSTNIVALEKAMNTLQVAFDTLWHIIEQQNPTFATSSSFIKSYIRIRKLEVEFSIYYRLFHQYLDQLPRTFVTPPTL